MTANRNTTIFTNQFRRLLAKSVFCVCAAMPTIALAAPDGFYANAGMTIADGPGTVSISRSALGSGAGYANGNQLGLFTLAEDGRFRYNLSLGYALRNLALEFKYIDLGTQKLLGINGNSLPAGAAGGFKSAYYGINGVGYIPVNKDVDFFAALGVGKLKTKMTVSDQDIFTTGSQQEVKQNETVLLLGAGIRYYLMNNLSVNAEYNHLTPVTHGLMNSGTYNTAFNMFSIGLTYAF